eukprot:9293449-Pyramimonas_sp.AAC.1
MPTGCLQPLPPPLLMAERVQWAPMLAPPASYCRSGWLPQRVAYRAWRALPLSPSLRRVYFTRLGSPPILLSAGALTA